jgi:hypothetical protein
LVMRRLIFKFKDCSLLHPDIQRLSWPYNLRF